MKRSILTTAALVAASMLIGSAAQAQPVFDHLKCYKISVKLPGGLKLKPNKYLLDLIPEQQQFLDEVGCELKDKPKWFCIDVQKTNVIPPPPNFEPGLQAQDYLCYKLKCPKGVKVPVNVIDQFREFAITVKDKPDHLCVPARKLIDPEPTPTPPAPTRTATVTPTPIPTATLQPPPCDFESATGQCNGACDSADEKCLFVGGTTICDCVPVQNMCNPDAVGLCNGLCPNASDDCLHVAGTTDCDCFPSQQTCKRDAVSGICGGTCPEDPAGIVLKCLAIGAMGCDCVPADQMCMPQQPIPPGTCGGLCPDPKDVCQGVAGGLCDCFPSSAGCDLHDTPFGPQCGGTCPPGELCVFDGVAPCSCSPDYCGPQPPLGQCGGPCPNPSHICRATTDPAAPCACSP